MAIIGADTITGGMVGGVLIETVSISSVSAAKIVLD